MAPKRKNTPAAEAKATQSKKRKVAPKIDPREEKIKAITNAILVHQEGDGELEEILTKAAEKCYAAPKDERHRFMTSFGTMIEETLQGYVTKFKTEVDEIQRLVDSADQIKAENIANLEKISADLCAKSDEVAEKEKEVDEKQKDTKEKAKELAAQRKNKAKSCAPLIVLEGDLEEASTKEEQFHDLRDNKTSASAAARKKQITAFNPYFKRMGVVDSLIASSQVALLAEERPDDSFDKIVVDQLQSGFTAFMAKLQKEIDEEKAKHVEILQGVDAAEEAASTAKAALDKAREELEALVELEAGLKDNKKAAEKAIKEHDKKIKEHADDLQTKTETKADLEQVFEGLVELRDTMSEAHMEKIRAEEKAAAAEAETEEETPADATAAAVAMEGVEEAEVPIEVPVEDVPASKYTDEPREAVLSVDTEKA